MINVCVGIKKNPKDYFLFFMSIIIINDVCRFITNSYFNIIHIQIIFEIAQNYLFLVVYCHK